MNFYPFILLIACLTHISYCFAAEKTVSRTSIKKSAPTKNVATLAPLKKYEYAVFIDDSYIIFKTQKYQSLELATDCLRQGKPKCLAFDASQNKPPPLKLRHEAVNNLAAVNCANIGGKNLIALDQNRSEYNFCRFHDNSMVNSWSVYFKYNPIPIIR